MQVGPRSERTESQVTVTVHLIDLNSTSCHGPRRLAKIHFGEQFPVSSAPGHAKPTESPLFIPWAVGATMRCRSDHGHIGANRRPSDDDAMARHALHEAADVLPSRLKRDGALGASSCGD